MANKMLIDASHPEETRVVVLRGNRIEEFDFESASKKPLRGNIYLAKVTRVEPSLQAAFIEYGGNRHGFLAFSEIHPDYYQIPVADRQALLEDEQRQQRDEEDEEPRGNNQRRSRRNRRTKGGRSEKRATNDETVTGEASFSSPEDGEAAHSVHDEPRVVRDAEGFEGLADAAPEGEPQTAAVTAENETQQARPGEWMPLDAPALEAPVAEAAHAADETAAVEALEGDRPRDAMEHERPHHESAEQPVEARAHEDDESDEHDDEEDDEDEEEEHVEQLGGDDIEEMPVRSTRQRKQYKIQEVIRRRQVLLVQVVKEERGNKGAALTTYLSLAGRYSVLMPNTARGGGISRKITDGEDRKRLKEIAQELEVPEGMGVILRTAGASRTKQEVRRDFEYLLRMWESVRELTLQSSAPTLVYEEGSLIKRSIRDLYGKEIDEVVVAGDDAYKEASAYMGMLMPSHVKNVKPWRENQQLFARMGVEAQLDAMFSAQVTLKSGGYIVINQTEALVAIDVNSGRSTREHNIEDTALRTNLEASDEVARQLRLRDLAGLIVVDFIDMEENRNNRAVERRLKEALKNDRARIQVGRISHFGLLEMSRQRMRTGVLEGSSVVCPHCSGAGTVRSTASIALHILRVIEDALVRNTQYNLTVRTRTIVALYILNQKRAHLRDIEERFGVTLTIEADDTLTGAVYHALEQGDLASAPPAAPKQGLVRLDSIARAPEPEEEVEETEAEETDEEGDEESAAGSAEDANGEGRKRRRRRRRRGRDRDSSGIDSDAPQPSDEALAQLGGDIPALAIATVSDGEVDEAQAEKEGEDVLAEGESAEGRKRRRPRRGRGGRERAEGDHAAQPGFRSPYGSWVRSSDHAEPDFVPPEGAPQPEVVDLSQIEQQPARQTELQLDQPVMTQAVSPEASVSAPEETVPVPAVEPVHATPVHAVAEPTPAPAPVPEPVVHQPPVAPVEAAPEPQPEPTPVRAAEPLPEAAPPVQKRQGWWSRTKAQISGE